MPSVPQNSFTGGEWSPALYTRTDLAKYKTAVRRMENMFPHKHGGTSNRPGTQFIAEVKDSTKRTRLYPFQFSVVQSYIIEIGDLYFRFYRDGGQIVNSAGNGLDIVEAATYKWTLSANGTNEYYLELLAGGDPGLAEPVYVYEDVGGANTTMPEGTLGALAAGETAYGDNDALGFSTIYVRLTNNADPDTEGDGYLQAGYLTEVVTPYVEADIPLLKFEQSADVLYITHPSYAPRKLSRTDHDIWTLSVLTFTSNIEAPTGFAVTGAGVDVRYGVTAVNAAGEESVLSNTDFGLPGETATWTAVSGASYYNVYKDSNQSGTYGWIGQANDTTFFEPSGGIIPDYNITPPEEVNPFNAADDYPGVAAFFEQRLLFLRTNNKPQTVWGSVVGAFNNMNISTPLRDDDAYEFTINSRQVNEIRWAVALDVLIIGTSGSEWRMQPGGGVAITPTSVDIKVQSRWGVSHVAPVIVGNTILFIQGAGKIVRDLVFSFEVDGYSGNDLSVLSEHLLRNNEIEEWSYAQYPNSIIWAVRDDGRLLGLTYEREQQVWGWHQHVTDGSFESVATISTEENKDQTYYIVKRVIDGVTKRYVELFRERLPRNPNFVVDIRDAYFVDCGLTLDNPVSITNITQANPAVVTAPAHGFSNGDEVDITTVLGMLEINPDITTINGTEPGQKRYKIKNVAANTFELTDLADVNIDSTGFSAYTSGGQVRKAVQVLSGLDHLEGKDVVALVDGSVESNHTVAAGSVTLDNKGSRIHIGLGYTSYLETLDADYPIADSPSVADLKRTVDSAVIRLEDTRHLEFGPTLTRLDPIDFRTTEPFDQPTNKFTGDKEVTPQAGPDRQSRIIIKNDQPLPITVTAIILRITNEVI